VAGLVPDGRDAMKGEDPTLADIAARWPRWETWRGIDGLFHARLFGVTDAKTSKPVMVRGESPEDLSHEIQRWGRAT
jgi:hypothetical protein